jgi:hypothetical protein
MDPLPRSDGLVAGLSMPQRGVTWRQLQLHGTDESRKRNDRRQDQDQRDKTGKHVKSDRGRREESSRHQRSTVEAGARISEDDMDVASLPKDGINKSVGQHEGGRTVASEARVFRRSEQRKPNVNMSPRPGSKMIDLTLDSEDRRSRPGE